MWKAHRDTAQVGKPLRLVERLAPSWHWDLSVLSSTIRLMVDVLLWYSNKVFRPRKSFPNEKPRVDDQLRDSRPRSVRHSLFMQLVIDCTTFCFRDWIKGHEFFNIQLCRTECKYHMSVKASKGKIGGEGKSDACPSDCSSSLCHF